LTNHNYSGVNSQTLNADGTVSMTCWPNWSYDANNTTAVDNKYYMNGLQFNNGELVCDVDRSVLESKPKTQLCEVYDDATDNC
jgi:hypothetical protein